MATASNEIKNLRRDLLSANEAIEELQYELKRYQDNLAEAIADRNRYKTEIFEARDMILNIRQQVNDQVTKAVNSEKEKVREKLEMFDQLSKDLNNEKDAYRNLNEILNEKEALISKYKQNLRQIAQENPDNYELAEKIQDIENFREDRIINVKQLQKLTSQNQTLCNQMEDILAENRLLRNLAQVPENYGFDLEEIKLAERQKIEDYKAQVRYQEKEIEELEEERAKLRYRLRQMSTLFSNKPGERYKDLTPDQLYIIDQYAMNLKENINEVPLNDRSRELQRENDKLKGQIEILENQNFGSLETYFEKFKDKMPQKNLEAFDSLKKNEDEIKQYIVKLMEAMGTQKDQLPQAQQQPVSLLSMPPTPIPGPFGNWGDIREGYSYRFNSKMAVDTHALYNEGGFDQIAAKYEIAFLQLHNLECLRLLHQKENEYLSLTNESKELKEEIKKCLLVEDELFKSFFNEKKTMTEKMQELQKKFDASVEEVAEMTAKLRVLEDSFNEIISKNPTSIEAKLAHHTKRVALLDVNLIRLSRKYDCLFEEEKQLREAYFKAETNNAEKQEYLSEKLFNLIEWRSKASKQLEILLEFQKNSFSADERNNLLTRLELMTNRYSDILIKESDYKKKLAIKESAERELFEKKEENRSLENEVVEIELELEVMKKRLEQLDPHFKKYMAVFQQIVDVIKEQNISPLSVFKMFDSNDDGKISKNEFSTALRSMKVMVTPDELDILFLFIDLDGTGNIEYKEFLRRLRRSGVQIRRKEDDLIFSIYKAITEVGLSLEQAFEAFDRNGDNMISKKDMIDTFVSMGRNVDNESIDYIFKVADVSGDGLINYEEFYRLFDTIVKDSKMENKRQTKMELDWKMELMLKIDTVIHNQNLQLYDAFNMIDTNGDQKLTFDEFLEMFKQMNVPIPASELKNLFDCIDLGHNNEISYNELLNYVRECRRENERIKRLKFLSERTENIRNTSNLQAKEKEIEENNPITEANRFKMKITLLEIRERNSNQKIETLLHQLKNSEDIIGDNNNYIKDLEISLLKSNEQYYCEREKNIELQEKVNGGIPKKEADLLKLESDRLYIENAALKAANNTFRNLYQASMHQTSVLRITVEKSRSEVTTFKKTIKELQGSGDKESMIGKLYYSLMISKWNEGEVNKKYDGILTEFRRIANSLHSIEEKVDEKEDEIYEVHTVYKEKILHSEKTIAELRLKIIPTITVTRIENLAHTVKEFSAMKTDLEIINKRLRDNNYEIANKLDALETYKSVLEELEKRLKNTYSDDMSQQLIEMSEKLREFKLSELKAKRESSVALEKEEYYQRIGRQNLENIKTIENELAEWNIKFAKREEFWHKRYNEQVKIVFSKAGGQESGSSSDKNSLEKGFEFYKRKVPNEKANQGHISEIVQKNTEISVLKKRLEESEGKLEDNLKKIKELEDHIQLKENDISTGNKISKNINSEETERLTMAAHKTIQTLQGIISDQNEASDRKEKYIEKLKQEFYLQKENDVLEIKELYEQIRQQNKDYSKQKFSQLQGTPSFMSGSRQQGNVPSNMMPEINKLLNEKDERIEVLASQMDIEKKVKKQLENNNMGLLQEIEELKKDLFVEKEKNAPEKFAQEIETLKKLIKHKDKEIKGFKDSLMKLKEEFFKACDEKLETEKEYQSLQNKLTSQGSNNSQIETKLRLATKKIEEVNGKIRQADSQIEELKIKEIEWKEKFNNMKQEKERLQDLLDKASRDRQRKREPSSEKMNIEEKNIGAFFKPKENNKTFQENKWKKMVDDKEIDVKTGFDEHSDFEGKGLKGKILELERENANLKNDKAPNLIDQNGYLQKENALGFKDLKDLIETIREWLKVNPQINIYKSMQENDKKKTGLLASEVLYNELKLNGINLKPRDQALLDKNLKDSKGFMNYIEFYYLLKNMKNIEINSKQKGEPVLEKNISLKEKPITTSEKVVVDVLKNNLAEMKKEKNLLEKQLNNWKENAMNYQNQLKSLQNKFPKENVEEALKSNKNFVNLQDYKDKIYKLEEKMQALQKALTVDKEIELNKIYEEKRKLEIDLKNYRIENSKLRSEIESLSMKKLNENEIKREFESGKDLIISNLKGKIDESRENEQFLKKKLMEAEGKILDLQFVKENFDTQIERYQRRVTELEDVKSFYEVVGNKNAKPIKQSAMAKKEGFKTLKK